MEAPVQFHKSPAVTDLLHDDFSDNRNNWEITDSDSEYAAIGDEGYVLENRGQTRWTFYHLPTALRRTDSFELTATLRMLDKKLNGQLGLVWGFDAAPQLLNRFTVDAGLRRATVLNFERNHHRIFHRFSIEMKNPPMASEPFTLRIRLERPYYQFWLNDTLVYIGHEAHFVREGNQIGFYVEPGLRVAVESVQLSRLVQE